jgi:hypothetical protein
MWHNTIEVIYPFVLSMHNLLRWMIVIFGLGAMIRAYSGWIGKKEWIILDNKAGNLFMSSLDIQVMVGLLLYFWLSPLTSVALHNFSQAMADSSTRFYSATHLGVMIVAMIIAHIGRELAAQLEDPVIRHRCIAIAFTLAMVMILLAIPWPFTEQTRPWLRVFGLVY